METRKEIAAEKKRCGSHNCTQAVLCTYHDFAGMEEETIKNVGNAFTAGMGNMEGTCGAIVGAGIILGLATQDKAKSVNRLWINSSSATVPHNANCSKVWVRERCFANALFAWLTLLNFWKRFWKRKVNMPSQMMNEGVRKYGIRL
ncbi:C-GCAxxG-C-C family protein [Prevotella sp.]|uniref:C-GCAxxG-C-C family protein n=1 Tax=Prevotella sp. TaxID=59823 RepID=UPI00402591C0